MKFSPEICCCFLHPITKYGYPPPAEKTEIYLEDMAAMGFQTVELEGIREEHLLAVSAQKDAIRDKLQSLGLKLPYFCIILPGLSSADADTRAQSLRLFADGCRTAAHFGSTGVLDNAPLAPLEFDKSLPVARHYDDKKLQAAALPAGLDWGQYWRGVTSTYREACDIAASMGLTYLMHPIMGTLCATTDGFLNFRDAVDRDNLRFNLDTANQFMLRENLALAVHRLKGSLDYVHISDNGGGRVEHLPPGEGAIAWEPFFQALRDTGFDGLLGVDLGGAETPIPDLDAAYIHAARWIEERWIQPRTPQSTHPIKQPASLS
ncbi:MAG TPA: sugar phosphate isomerase/epimerase family protein [Terrimicrobiaceae bacterium]|nr:sugar phosphate isomerase/epimerase family protein [Terrimicrobiaceae bacterium]